VLNRNRLSNNRLFSNRLPSIKYKLLKLLFQYKFSMQHSQWFINNLFNLQHSSLCLNRLLFSNLSPSPKLSLNNLHNRSLLQLISKLLRANKLLKWPVFLLLRHSLLLPRKFSLLHSLLWSNQLTLRHPMYRDRCTSNSNSKWSWCKCQLRLVLLILNLFNLRWVSTLALRHKISIPLFQFKSSMHLQLLSLSSHNNHLKIIPHLSHPRLRLQQALLTVKNLLKISVKELHQSNNLLLERVVASSLALCTLQSLVKIVLLTTQPGCESYIKDRYKIYNEYNTNSIN